MKIEGSESIALVLDEAWRGVNDPAVLRACTPGLTQLVESQPDHFEAVLEVKIPAMTGRFEGQVEIVEREAPRRMKIKLKGKGAPGFVDGTAELQLAAADGGKTAVRYVADVNVGGQIARLGQRMIGGVTKEMAGQFFEALEKALAPPQAGPASAGGGEAAAVIAAASGPPALPRQPNPILAFLQLVWRVLLNLLGLSKRS